MAQTPEAKVKIFIDKYMKDNFEGIWRYAPPGGMYGNAGMPDRVYLWNGIFIAIEAKAEGNSPTKSQWMQLNHVAQQGGVAAVVVGKDINKMNKIKNAIMEKLKDEHKITIRKISVADEVNQSKTIFTSDRIDEI